MNRIYTQQLFLAYILALSLSFGCSRFPESPSPPKVNPAEVAQGVLKAYDTNSDGALDDEELKKAPAIAVAIERIDTDGDGNLSESEIVARIRSWGDSPTTITGGNVYVTLDREPLEGATVTFEPEPYLGDSFTSQSGETDLMGETFITGHDEKFSGIYLGFYKVRISKIVDGTETLPARYNSETELGHEMATDIEGIGYISFDLTTLN